MEEAQRQAALAVRRVLDGSTLAAALAAVAASADASHENPGRRRALVQELTYGTLRHWGTLDALTRALATRSFSDAAIASLVAVAIYQLDHTRAPPFAIVDNAVNAAAKIARPAAKSLVNALLRRYLRERETLRTAISADPVGQWSYPRWWIDRVHAEYADAWQSVLAAGNERPPLALRVNRRWSTREALIETLTAAGLNTLAAGEFGVIVEPPKPIAELPGFEQGLFTVQDLGAQLAAPLLRVEAGMRVLDACAAPGGKTTHIAELADVELTALDHDEPRLQRIRENVQRLRLDRERIRIVQGDAAAAPSWWDGRPFARILADVPCSASGVVRRHPDAKWLRRSADIAGFTSQQARILDGLWPCLERGGLLLYATCSIFEAENEGSVNAFCSRHSDALRESISFAPDVTHRGGQLLPSLPGAAHNQDGFFYALLRKA